MHKMRPEPQTKKKQGDERQAEKRRDELS